MELLLQIPFHVNRSLRYSHVFTTSPAAQGEYNLQLTSSIFAVMETASLCRSCLLVFSLWRCMFRPVLSLMTLTGLSRDDVLLDTPGQCTGAQWLCIIDPFGGEGVTVRPTPCPSLWTHWVRNPSQLAAPGDWLDRRASVRWTLL